MLLRDVVEAEELGIRVLYGDDEALSRPVLRACTTDMPDPTRYVSAGSLVFSGLVWRRSAEDSDLFVKRLVGAGVSALAAGEALFGCVPDDVVDACARHRMPLLVVPDEVPFSRVIEYMTGRMAGARMDRLRTGLARQRQWLAAVADGRSVGELLERLAQQYGVRARLITATGTIIEGGCLDDDALDRITAIAAGAVRFPAAAPGGPVVLSVGRGLSERLDAWYVVVHPDGAVRDPDGTGVDPECVEAFEELASVVALDRTRRDERRRVAWELADRATDRALGPGVVVVAEAEGDVPVPTLRGLLEDVLGESVTSVDASGRVVAVTPGSDTEVARVLRRRLGRLTPVLGRARLLVGVGGRCTGDNIVGAVRSATAAVAAARNDTAAVCVCRAELDSAVGLLSTLPDALRRSYADRLLGDVIEHDRRTDAGLLTTLETFLDCDGSWRRTADRLHVHLNTVRYRIGKVEALTGRSLTRTGDRFDLYLALRSLA
ncbi:PucR family transcriptional regulator [Rhodococcus sp. Z13]|uniref:PucR family transcriptional regulator n=1 Tax=Rhodococcus sacchari TaxID=2962047 RepID=A0ACD4DJ06_9NOCA|nr:PucR family transcriptional regulator [Rhodococcus sp. Z13]UYP20018.1 PucR family transcriptional regulator [Rhodococcus sp. Z13]